jgi:D-glycero-alpha-D-manno-heptose-7-phosphate kinase
MLIISRTPVRISFFGGGTDYVAYFLRQKGAVLGTTINQHIYVSLNTLSDFFEHKIRIGYSKAELVKIVDEIEHPSVRECLKFKEFNGNLDVHIFADLPAKTGLGSSSSFTVGFLNALYALQGKKISKQRLAEEACFVEQQRICENVGSQDQFHAAFGGFNIIEFSSSHIQVRPVIISKEKKDSLEEHLMIFYTGLTRFASDVVKEQIEKTTKKDNDAYLQKMLDMVYAAEDLITNCSKEDLVKEFAALLDKSWQMKKQLSSKITNPFIDDTYEKAKQAGAYGGKLCGAGSGGFLALFVPKDKQNDVRKALNNLLEVKFRFENEGSSIIYMKE